MSVETITDLRGVLAAVLEPAAPGDPPVVPYGADAVAPPVLVIRWADPWLETDSQLGPCCYRARLEVYAVTQRLEPASGTPEIEQMVSDVLRRLAADPYPWRAQVSAPGNLDYGGVIYFAAPVTITAPTVPNPEV